MGSAQIDWARPGMICSVNRSPCSAHLYSRELARDRRNLHCDVGRSPLKIDDVADGSRFDFIDLLSLFRCAI